MRGMRMADTIVEPVVSQRDLDTLGWGEQYAVRVDQLAAFLDCARGDRATPHTTH